MNLAMLLFSFQGRLNRTKYWSAALIYLAPIYLAVSIVCFVIRPGISSAISSTGVLNSYLLVAIFVIVGRIDDMV